MIKSFNHRRAVAQLYRNKFKSQGVVHNVEQAKSNTIDKIINVLGIAFCVVLGLILLIESVFFINLFINHLSN